MLVAKFESLLKMKYLKNMFLEELKRADLRYYFMYRIKKNNDMSYFCKKKKKEEPRRRGNRFTVNHKTLLFTCVVPSVSFCSEIWS